MKTTTTRYIVVSDNDEAKEVAKLLDEGYTLVTSWVTNYSVHHILTIEQGREVA